jgi:hypothetical protein
VRVRPIGLPVAVGSALAVLAARNCIRNAGRVPTPPADPPVVGERVSVLLPARDEAHRISPTVRSLLAQERVPDLEILVLDDNSTDGTGELVTALAAGDPRLRVLRGRPLADGWKGKPHACMQLAEAATGDVLVFVDADVEFAPIAVAAAVATLRSAGLGLLSPFPRQLMGSPIERLYQPMINWTWMANLPRTADPATGLPGTVVANGQFLVLDAAAYRKAGGHGAIRQAVLDDLALLHAVLATGAKAAAVDGTALAACRMYRGGRELVDGYTKWMCDWVDTPRKVAWAAGTVGLVDVLPFLAALRGSRIGLVGYLGSVFGRVVVARRFAEPALPYALAHPAAATMSVAMIVESRRRSRRGARTWKGRTV